MIVSEMRAAFATRFGAWRNARRGRLVKRRLDFRLRFLLRLWDATWSDWEVRSVNALPQNADWLELWDFDSPQRCQAFTACTLADGRKVVISASFYMTPTNPRLIAPMHWAQLQVWLEMPANDSYRGWSGSARSFTSRREFYKAISDYARKTTA